MNFSENLLSDEYGYSSVAGGLITTVVSGSALVLSPLFGLLLDKVGYRGYSVLASSFGLTAAFIIFMSTNNIIMMFIAMALIGVAFSLVSAGLWPCITFLVEEEAYGQKKKSKFLYPNIFHCETIFLIQKVSLSVLWDVELTLLDYS